MDEMIDNIIAESTTPAPVPAKLEKEEPTDIAEFKLKATAIALEMLDNSALSTKELKDLVSAMDLLAKLGKEENTNNNNIVIAIQNIIGKTIDDV